MVRMWFLGGIIIIVNCCDVHQFTQLHSRSTTSWIRFLCWTQWTVLELVETRRWMESRPEWDVNQAWNETIQFLNSWFWNRFLGLLHVVNPLFYFLFLCFIILIKLNVSIQSSMFGLIFNLWWFYGINVQYTIQCLIILWYRMINVPTFSEIYSVLLSTIMQTVFNIEKN